MDNLFYARNFQYYKRQKYTFIVYQQHKIENQAIAISQTSIKKC